MLTFASSALLSTRVVVVDLASAIIVFPRKREETGGFSTHGRYSGVQIKRFFTKIGDSMNQVSQQPS